jgi:hypothetical protein
VVKEFSKRTLLHETGEVQVGFGALEVVDGDGDGSAGRLCVHVDAGRQQQAGAHSNEKILHGYLPSHCARSRL